VSSRRAAKGDGGEGASLYTSISVLMGCATTQENTASASTSMFGRLRASHENVRDGSAPLSQAHIRKVG
jgi:hypothetical protein